MAKKKNDKKNAFKQAKKASAVLPAALWDTVGAVYDTVSAGGGDATDAWMGGGGGGGYSYGPDPALVAALARLTDVENEYRQHIDNAEAGWRMRLAQLRQMAEQENAAIDSTIANDAAQAKALYDAAIAPITADLAAQGVTGSPLQQQAALDQMRLEDYARRQSDLAKRFAQIQQQAFADDEAAAAGQMAGARAILANNIAQLRAEMEAEGGGGGGGGGYSPRYRGRGGGGGDGDSGGPMDFIPPPLIDFKAGIQYTGKHPRLVKAMIRQINPDLSNTAAVFRRFKKEAVKQGLNKGGFLKQVKKQVVKPLIKAAPKAQQNKAARQLDAWKYMMWGN